MASKTSSNRRPSLVAERYDQMMGATHSRSVERCLSQARCQSLRQQGSRPDRRGQDYRTTASGDAPCLLCRRWRSKADTSGQENPALESSFLERPAMLHDTRLASHCERRQIGESRSSSRFRLKAGHLDHRCLLSGCLAQSTPEGLGAASQENQSPMIEAANAILE